MKNRTKEHNVWSSKHSAGRLRLAILFPFNANFLAMGGGGHGIQILRQAGLIVKMVPIVCL